MRYFNKFSKIAKRPN